jgi:hypothetical protein
MTRLNISEELIGRVLEAWEDASVAPGQQVHKGTQQLRMEVLSKVLNAT